MARGRSAVLAAALVLVAAAVLGAGSATGGPDAAGKSGRLVAFRSCGDLLGYVKAQTAPLVTPWGFAAAGGKIRGGPVPTAAADGGASRGAAPQQGVDYSGTNVQEEGVDEPDLVKTDGKTMFAIAGGRIVAVDVRDKRPRLLDTLKLEDGGAAELLLHGNRLLVLSRGGFWAEPLPALAARMMPYFPSRSILSEIDVSDPSALRLVRTLTLDGGYVAARLVGGSARIVIASQVPGPLPFAQPTGTTAGDLDAARSHNRDVVAQSSLGSWLPSYRIARAGRPGGAARPLVQCGHVLKPPAFSGVGMLTVLTVDLAKGLVPVDSVAVMTDGRIVYASPGSLYVATERWADRPDPNAPTKEQTGVTTAIHRFDIADPARTQYRGSGSVSGFLLSQWSLSEYRGVLRVVSTETPAWWGPGGDSESFVTTLRPRDGSLLQAGRVGGIGKGERVYAVRFTGDVGYVVTFRQIDPLHTLDLSDPEHPRVLGALELAGYSAYLHPLGDGLLLGIGQDATPEGRPLGTQLSLFDVSNLRRPVRLHHVALGQGWSEAESDHHAFLFWPRTGLVVVPFDQRAAAFRVGRSGGIDPLGRVEHPLSGGTVGWIRRSLVVGSSLFTVSDAGVRSNSLATLADQGWAAFPAPVAGGPLPR